MVNLITYHATQEARVLNFCAESEQVYQIHEAQSREQLLSIIASIDEVVEEWHVFGPMGVYGYYLGPVEYGEMLGQQDWVDLNKSFCPNRVMVFHDPKAKLWLAPYLAQWHKVKVCGEMVLPIKSSSLNYDESAELYDQAFENLKVREVEWSWLERKLLEWRNLNNKSPSLLEIGCGNGQMIRQLKESGLIKSGHGLDVSEGMLQRARARGGEATFSMIENSTIPAEDDSLDVVLSFMSFRYLDWPRICPEINRVLKTGGIFLMVDMAATELESEQDWERYRQTKEATELLHAKHPDFAEALAKLVRHPSWKEMLQHYPKRSAEEYRHFLTNQWGVGNWERLYTCYDHSLFAFSAIK